MTRLGLRQRTVLQVMLVVALIAAADNVRVPVSADAANLQQRGGPSSTTPSPTIPTTSSTVRIPATIPTVVVPAALPVAVPVTNPVTNSSVESSTTTVESSTTTVESSTTTVESSTTTVSVSTTGPTTVPTVVDPAVAPENSPSTAPVPGTSVETPTTSSSVVPAPSTTVRVRPVTGSTVVPATSTVADSVALEIRRTDSRPYLVTASNLVRNSGAVDLTLQLLSSVDQEAVDLGYVSVEVASADQSTSGQTSFSSPVQIRMPNLPVDGVVAESADGVMWDAIPYLRSMSLSSDQDIGYFVDVDGSIVVLTARTATVGIRKQRPPLEIRGIGQSLVPGSASKLDIAGQAGDAPIILTVSGGANSCTVSRSGVFRAIDGGPCTVTAVQGGGSMYMSAESSPVASLVQRVEDFRESVVAYRTSAGMVLLVGILSLFLVWQISQTFVDVRRALRTNPEAL